MAQAKTVLVFAGKPPAFTGNGDRNKQNADDQWGWRYIWEQCGGNKGTVTKRTIEARLTPIVGPLDWGSTDADKPLDQTQFYAEVQKLQTATRMAALFWAYGHKAGQRVQVDPHSTLMTRPRYNPETYARTADLVRCQAYADKQAELIKAHIVLAKCQQQAGQAAVAIEKKAAAFASAYVRRAPVVDDEPVVGRSLEDLIALRKLFSYVDKDDFGRVTKKAVTERVGAMLGSFSWSDARDTRLLTFQDFVGVMVEVPLEQRYRAIHWAKTACPDKIYPMAGGRPYFAKDGVAWN